MEDGEVQLHEEEKAEEEEQKGEELDDLQQFNVLLSVLVDLCLSINDYDAAISQIELYGDTIDDLCALVERLQWHKEFVTEGGLNCLLQMLSSVCDEVVNLALAGLERILSRWEVAEHAAKAGAFDLLVGILLKNREAESYATSKASDVLAFLLTPSPNRYLKEQAVNHSVFDLHMDMLFSENESLVERGLQFLWCITNSYPEAQRKICRIPKVVEKILQAITDSDAGKNALRVLHNISIHESALVTLPVQEIEKILASILKIPNPYIASGDKEIAALVLAALSPAINVEAVGGLVLNQLEATLYDYLHDELRHYDLPDLIQAINQITTALLLKDLDKVVEDSNVAGDLIFLLAAGSSIATSDEKALASQVALALVKRRLSLKTFQNEDTLEILEILEDSDDERLVRNCYSILRFLREAEQDHDHKLRRVEGFHDSPKPQPRNPLSPRLPELRTRSPSSASLSPVTPPTSPPFPSGSPPLSPHLSDLRPRSASSSSLIPPGPSSNSPPLPPSSPTHSPRPELRPRSPSAPSLLSPGSPSVSSGICLLPLPPGSSPLSSFLPPRSSLSPSVSPSRPRRYSTDLPEEEVEKEKEIQGQKGKEMELKDEIKEGEKEVKEEAKDNSGEKSAVEKELPKENDESNSQTIQNGDLEQGRDKQTHEKPHIPHEPHEVKAKKEANESNGSRETSETNESGRETSKAKRAPIDEAAAEIEIFRERALPTLDPHNPHPHDPPQIVLSPTATLPPLASPPSSSSLPLPTTSHTTPQIVFSSTPTQSAFSSFSSSSSPSSSPSHSSPVEQSEKEPKSERSQTTNCAYTQNQAIEINNGGMNSVPFESKTERASELEVRAPAHQNPQANENNTHNNENVLHLINPEIDTTRQATNRIPENGTDTKSKRFDDLGAWSCGDVCEWLAELGLSQYKSTFISQRITGRSLRELVRRVDDLQFLQFLGSSLHLAIGDLFTLADGLRELKR